jgi:hypothetical protein
VPPQPSMVPCPSAKTAIRSMTGLINTWTFHSNPASTNNVCPRPANGLLSNVNNSPPTNVHAPRLKFHSDSTQINQEN